MLAYEGLVIWLKLKMEIKFYEFSGSIRFLSGLAVALYGFMRIQEPFKHVVKSQCPHSLRKENALIPFAPSFTKG